MSYSLPKKWQLTLIALVLLFALAQCTSNDPESQFSEMVTARILKPTCGGTVMQIINGKVKGEDWRFFSNLNGPFDSSNQEAIYENTVLVGNVPLDRRVFGDTLQFSYNQGLNPGNYCEIGGLPQLAISVQTIKDKR